MSRLHTFIHMPALRGPAVQSIIGALSTPTKQRTTVTETESVLFHLDYVSGELMELLYICR